MTLLQFLKLYGVGAVVCFGLDVLWLGVLARTFYQNQLGYLMRPDVRWVPALLFYLDLRRGLDRHRGDPGGGEAVASHAPS